MNDAIVRKKLKWVRRIVSDRCIDCGAPDGAEGRYGEIVMTEGVLECNQCVAWGDSEYADTPQNPVNARKNE